MTRNSGLNRQWEILRTPEGSDGAGPPERIEIEFDVQIARHIQSRDWHPTQQLRTDVDGSVRMTVDICPDQMLRRWILSFGPLARVVSPSTLAQRIIEELDATRQRYAPRMDFELPIVVLEELDAQDELNFPP
jgi:predicted DNA-binding transcriptional regulator YafY